MHKHTTNRRKKKANSIRFDESIHVDEKQLRLLVPQKEKDNERETEEIIFRGPRELRNQVDLVGNRTPDISESYQTKQAEPKPAVSKAPSDNIPLLDNIPLSEAPTVGTQPTVGYKPTVGQKSTALIKKPRFFIEAEVTDELMERLGPLEKLVYFRLYRLSYGFGRDTTDPVGATAIARWCGISKDSVLDAFKSLTDKGLIALVERINTQTIKGSRWRIFISMGKGNTIGLNPTVGDNPIVGSRPTVGQKQTINIDDDDLNTIDHHQSETMKIYTSLTGNSWTKADQAAYQKIKEVPLATIEQGIRLASQRAASRPNSLAYFVKEILNLAQPSKQGRTQQRKALEKVVAQVRAAHTGARDYSTADFCEDIKRAAAREGIAYENDLLNEILKIRSSISDQ